MRSAVVDLGARPVRNVVRNPKPINTLGFGSAGASGVSSYVSTGGPTGGGFYRKTFSEVGTLGAYFGSNQTYRPLVNPNSSYRVSAYVRASRDVASMRFAVERKMEDGTSSGADAAGMTVSLVGGVWKRLSIVVPTIATVGSFTIAFYNQAGSEWQVGDTQDVALISVVETVLDFPYFDGDIPGYGWVSTPGGSESVGYPYTLESIAGKPDVFLTSPGFADTSVNPLDGRTLYAVVDIIDNLDDYPAHATFGSTANGGMTFGGSASGAGSLRTRYDGLGGSTNLINSVTGTRTPGRHVACSWIGDGFTVAGMAVDGVGETERAMNPGTGASGANGKRVQFVSSNPSGSTLAVLGYPQAHDSITRNRVMAWLGRQYGGPIPAGY